MACGAWEVCSGSACSLQCTGGTVKCGNACTNTAFDPQNCGACGTTCPGAPNAAASCAGGACGLVCSAPFLNCNGSAADGCEKNGATDPQNCGACGNACPGVANGAPTCTSGACSFACVAGYGDCDMQAGNGCEVTLASNDAHCGSCGNACPIGQTCSAGACVAGPFCSNGSPVDCNVAGTTLLPGSAFVDPSPPATWTQCAGFVNTSGDDVAANFLDNCLNTTRLRIRVFTSANVLEEDTYVTNMSSWAAWPNFNYLGGGQVSPVKTFWGTTTFFTNTDGKDACLHVAAPSGTVFGTGNGSVAVIAGGNAGYLEYRINCSGMALPDRKVALYR
jgi:hypothetical protein